MFYLLSLEGGLVRGSFCTNFHSSMVQTMEFRFNVSARALNVCTYKCLHAMMKNGHRKLVKTANFSFFSNGHIHFLKSEHRLNKIISQIFTQFFNQFDHHFLSFWPFRLFVPFWPFWLFLTIVIIFDWKVQNSVIIYFGFTLIVWNVSNFSSVNSAWLWTPTLLNEKCGEI